MEDGDDSVRARLAAASALAGIALTTERLDTLVERWKAFRETVHRLPESSSDEPDGGS